MPIDLSRGRRDPEDERLRQPQCLVHDWNCPRLDGDPLAHRDLARMLCEAHGRPEPPRSGPCRFESPAQVQARLREYAELLRQARAENEARFAEILAEGARRAD